MTSTVFSVEGNISLPDHFQSYYLLACSNCNHFVRAKTQRKINCLNCVMQTMLVPRFQGRLTNEISYFHCGRYFEIDIADSSGILTTIVCEVLAENMLSMMAKQIYNTVATKFGHIVFKIQLHKPPFRIPDQKINTLAISSFSEKEPMFFERLLASIFLGEGSKKPKKDVPTSKKQ